MDDIAVTYNFNYIFITAINHATVITLYNIELWEQQIMLKLESQTYEGFTNCTLRISYVRYSDGILELAARFLYLSQTGFCTFLLLSKSW